MDATKKEHMASLYGAIGGLGDDVPQTGNGRYTVLQSLWTKPIKDSVRLKRTLFMAALSLEYAHRSGYRVNMHTDSKGYSLLKNFGYDKLLTTLNKIPDTVPTEMFAAGKFFAMREDGALGKVHIDYDVFLKKPVLDNFYKDSRIDVICQQEEDYERICFHGDKIRPMHILGYPAGTRPDWKGSLNTGIIGFNNPVLAAKYMSNYFEALEMYTAEMFESYKKKDGNACMLFDFILEQVNLSYMSVGYNVYTLVPMHNPTAVADEIGYCHLQGDAKWQAGDRIMSRLCDMNRRLYSEAKEASDMV